MVQVSCRTHGKNLLMHHDIEKHLMVGQSKWARESSLLLKVKQQSWDNPLIIKLFMNAEHPWCNYLPQFLSSTIQGWLWRISCQHKGSGKHLNPNNEFRTTVWVYWSSVLHVINQLFSMVGSRPLWGVKWFFHRDHLGPSAYQIVILLFITVANYSDEAAVKIIYGWESPQ